MRDFQRSIKLKRTIKNNAPLSRIHTDHITSDQRRMPLALLLSEAYTGLLHTLLALNGKIGELYPFLGQYGFELVVAVIVLISIFLKQNGLKNILPSSNKPQQTLVDFVYHWNVVNTPGNRSFRILGLWEATTWLKLIIFYVMTVALINDRQDLEKMLWAIVLVSAWIAYEPVVNYMNGVASQHGYGDVASGRFGAAAGHVALSNTLNQTIPLIIFFAATLRNIMRRRYYIIRNIRPSNFRNYTYKIAGRFYRPYCYSLRIDLPKPKKIEDGGHSNRRLYNFIYICRRQIHKPYEYNHSRYTWESFGK